MNELPRIKFIGFLHIIFIFLLLMNCTKTYRPQSEWEKQEFKKSNFKIYPEDVRKNLDQYLDKKVAWPGIIFETEFYENPENYQLVMLLEHRYYNWEKGANKTGIQYFLSSEGEGWFQTSWYFKKDTEKSYIRKEFSPGNLAFVYGVPDTVVEGDVILTSNYVRVIDEEKYDAEFYHYIPEGRKGDLPAKNSPSP